MSVLTHSERKAMRTYAENMTWFRAHYEGLRKEHTNQFVAISNGHVIDSDYNPDRLIKRLRENYGQEAITAFAVEFVAKDNLELLL